MKIYKSFDEIKNSIDAVITIGTFDGLHLGHLEIFKVLKEKGEELKAETMVITFEPHPRTIISKDFKINILTTSEERFIVLRNFGINNLLVINFNKEIASLTAEEFFDLLSNAGLNIKHVVVGYDHKFGKNRSGDEHTIRKIGIDKNFEVTTVNAIKYSEMEISSTKIRNILIDSGDINLVNHYLGRPYSLIGTVIDGEKRGRKIGFPTANIYVENENKMIPQNGVYFVKATIDDTELYGLMNIGFRPTFNNDKIISLEVHLLNFNKEIYGQTILIEFLERIREEMKFNNADELIKQIENDIEKAKKIKNKYLN
jgi:riboflavin kinase/FMN adenylyltransferase